MKLLIATDGSDFSKAAVEEACRMLTNIGTDSIMVVSAFEEQIALAAEPFAFSAQYYQELVEGAAANARSYAESAAEMLRRITGIPDLDIDIRVVAGPPEKEIVELAASWGADLIIVGSHGRGFWGRMLGSVSDGVLHHAPCSVLVVRKSTGKRQSSLN